MAWTREERELVEAIAAKLDASLLAQAAAEVRRESTDGRVVALEHTTFGNGRPGLAHRTTVLETQVGVARWLSGTAISVVGLLIAGLSAWVAVH